ncbi:hypothetical protein EV13_2037 [Prochlorococcus sp. MIT 0702]|nr:hypothetical protein EV13_2037 [Prochlorococcus sp. MIT 0702]KGG28196.1 hypothetical protein EV12_0946 [Prochlorococcus sp. MIT 0701]KGG37246.1 hypothetical protein EV14_0038 [Prochlorococcus sp. MIT 0703]
MIGSLEFLKILAGEEAAVCCIWARLGFNLFGAFDFLLW